MRVLADEPVSGAIGSSSLAGPELLRYLPNDHGNAERLIAMHGDGLKYCHSIRKWLVWDGRRWAVDETDQARRRAKSAMLEFLRQAVAIGIARERSFGWPWRQIGPLQALRPGAPGANMTYAVADDMTGGTIPCPGVGSWQWAWTVAHHEGRRWRPTRRRGCALALW